MNLSSTLPDWERSMIIVYFSRKPDLPATFESLNDDTLTTVLEFLGNKSYGSFGGTNKHCKEVYLASGKTKKTFLFEYAPLSVIKDRYERAIEKDDDDYYDDDDDEELDQRVGKGVVLYNRSDVLVWAVQERKELVLRAICDLAAEEGRLDILNEVLINVNESGIFEYVDYHAAECGKLNVLKWLETKGFDVNEYVCADQAARHGQPHILQWLQEEKDLQLCEGLYNKTIWGGHINVLKWLREQEVPWGERTFKLTAQKGNLNILQWLHDRGCPWPNNDTYRVGEYALKPEVVEWCRGNGYGDRIV